MEINSLQGQVSDIFRKQMKHYLMKYIPTDLPLELPEKTENTIKRNKEFVSSFLDKWIPILYGIPKYHNLYRHACLTELVRWTLVFGLPLSKKFQCHWYWEENKVGSVPERLVVIAGTANIIYTIMRVLGILPKYNIRRF